MENRTKVTGICSLSYHDLKTIDGGNVCGPMGPSRLSRRAYRGFRDAGDWFHGFLDGFLG